MKSTETMLWEYRREDGSHRVAVYQREDGILIARAAGVVMDEGASELRAFVDRHAQEAGRKLRIAFDNTNVERVEHAARRTSASFAGKDSPTDKMATFGDNMFMRAFVNLYASIARIPVKSFSTEDQAVAWLIPGRVEDAK